jgi:hypothetical protein
MNELESLKDLEKSARKIYEVIKSTYREENQVLLLAQMVMIKASQEYGFEDEAGILEALKMTLQMNSLKKLIMGEGI